MENKFPHNPSELKLVSPVFRPQPGWGGQIARWYRKDGRTLVVRLVILIAIPVVLAPLLNRTGLFSVPESVPLETPRPVIVVTIEPGKGLIHGARLALYEYLAVQEVSLALAPEQYVFAEDWIVRRMEPYVPAPGETLEFPHSVLSAAVLKAQSMTPQERASWLRFVR